MFTGLVEGVGKVVSFEEKKAAWLLKLQAPEFIAETLSDGDSLACNGCCLTLIGRDANELSFELLEETNKEKALKMAQELKDFNDT